ncbi:MAG: hypothetical protein V4508_01280 [Pseudomonadota bacterium]
MSASRAVVLVLTLLAHLLLIMGWQAARSRHAGASGLSRPYVAWLLAPAARKPAPVRAIVHAPVMSRVAPLPAPVQRPPIEAPLTVVPSEARAAPSDTLTARARNSAGAIDRELRTGTPAVPALRPDSPQQRFERLMATAYIDRSLTLTSDHYTAADGVTITRLTQGGQSRCYMSGNVNFTPGILHDSARPQTVNCPPADSHWVR